MEALGYAKRHSKCSCSATEAISIILHYRYVGNKQTAKRNYVNQKFLCQCQTNGFHIVAAERCKNEIM